MRRGRHTVVGEGYIAQIAVLPAFAHARRNSELTALAPCRRTRLPPRLAQEIERPPVRKPRLVRAEPPSPD